MNQFEIPNIVNEEDEDFNKILIKICKHNKEKIDDVLEDDGL